MDLLRGQRILIAEDLIYNQAVMQGTIRSIGRDCVMVTNGLELLSVYESSHEQFCAVLTDFDMPGLDGLEATAKIREFEANMGIPEKPILLISGNASVGLRKRA